MSELSSYLNDLHKNETDDEKRQRNRDKFKNWYSNIKENETLHRAYVEKQQIRYWVNLFGKIEPDDYWKRLAKLYIKNPELAKKIKSQLN